MRRPSRTGMSCLFVLITSIPLTAQNLHAIGREEPLTVSGGVSVNQIFYSGRGITARRDPYSLFASGNVTLSLYGWSIPLTFTFSNRSTAFSQPFNRYGIHPTWEWITVHAGYTSMSFSPYTVSGHIFAGAGIDLAPQGNWKLSALYGRFARAVESDSSGRTPSFERTGYGLKATYGGSGNLVEVILFRAADDKDSILPPSDSSGIAPRENFVVSLGGAKTVRRHWLLKAELASSALTRDARAAPAGHTHFLARQKLFFQPRQSSSYYHAFRSSVDYRREAWMAGFAYERVDPDYQTLGAYYFNNDLENITVNLSTSAAAGKLTVAGSGGLQRDDLGRTKVSRMRRMVGAVNANYSPSQRYSLSASYSGFQTYTHIRPVLEMLDQLTPYDHADTLNFTQISRNASFSGVMMLKGSDDRRESVNLSITWQKAADRQGQTEQLSGTSFVNLVAGYAVNFSPRNTSMALNFNTSINQGQDLHTMMTGPHASVARTFLQRRLRTAFTSSWNQSRSNGAVTGQVLNLRLNGTLTIAGKHNVNLSAVAARRSSMRDAAMQSFMEFTTTMGYSYSFTSGKRKATKISHPPNEKAMRDEP